MTGVQTCALPIFTNLVGHELHRDLLAGRHVGADLEVSLRREHHKSVPRQQGAVLQDETHGHADLHDQTVGLEEVAVDLDARHLHVAGELRDAEAR